MNSNQMGRFRLDEEFVRKDPESVAAIFAMMKCVPVRAEMLFSGRCVEYIAISELFEEWPQDWPAPKYNIDFSFVDGRLESVEATKVVS